MTNLLAHVSLAYKMAASLLMLDEANFFAEKLDLPVPHPMEFSNIVGIGVSPPIVGFGGNLHTTNYVFSFPDGKLCFISRFIQGQDNSREAMLRRRRDLVKIPSLIDTNGAFQLATQWLRAVSADMKRLEKLPVTVQQEYFLDPENRAAGKQLVPVFNVFWGQEMSTPVRVGILGWNKQPLEIRFEDFSFLLRPPLLITNAQDLNSRPDPMPQKILPKGG